MQKCDRITPWGWHI